MNGIEIRPIGELEKEQTKLLGLFGKLGKKLDNLEEIARGFRDEMNEVERQLRVVEERIARRKRAA